MYSKIVFLLFVIGLVFACSSYDQKGKDTNDSIAVDSTNIFADDLTPATSVPDWAKELGLSEPQNMKLLADMSHLTSAGEPAEGFNSVTLVYSGNYDTAMNQARSIAKAAKLTPSKEYIALKKQAAHSGQHNMVKGIAYLNYDLSTRDIDFLIYVQVDEKGMLTVSVTDMKQMNLQLSKHVGIENRKK